MFRQVCAFVLVVLMSAPVSADPFAPVQHFFAAISASDYDRLRSLVTDDFELLEVGELWDIEKLISVIPPGGFERRNFFSPISVRIQGDLAWVSYWNKAIVVTGSESSERAWLESAVMLKSSAGWKIQMLHSTRIKSEDIPQNVKLLEYSED